MVTQRFEKVHPVILWYRCSDSQALTFTLVGGVTAAGFQFPDQLLQV